MGKSSLNPFEGEGQIERGSFFLEVLCVTKKSSDNRLSTQTCTLQRKRAIFIVCFRVFPKNHGFWKTNRCFFGKTELLTLGRRRRRRAQCGPWESYQICTTLQWLGAGRMGHFSSHFFGFRMFQAQKHQPNKAPGNPKKDSEKNS